MSKKPKFRSGQIVKDALGNHHPRRICEIRNGMYYCVRSKWVGEVEMHWFKESELRPLTKRERGAA